MSDTRLHQLQSRYYLKGSSPLYQQALRQCRQASQICAPVLLVGETGTGKEVLARYLHAISPRQDKAFLLVDCATLPLGPLGQLLPAPEQLPPFLRGGTLFLDQVGELAPAIQQQLLDALPLWKGEQGPPVLRLVCSTGKNLEEVVEAGRFSAPLYHQLSAVTIPVPPLRCRGEDLEGLISFFIRKSQRCSGSRVRRVETQVLRFLRQYSYPGNLREMETLIFRMAELAERGIIGKAVLSALYGNLWEDSTPQPGRGRAYGKILPWKEFKHQSEMEYLCWVLEQAGGNVSEAARLVKLSSRQLFNKISEYHLRKP